MLGDLLGHWWGIPMEPALGQYAEWLHSSIAAPIPADRYKLGPPTTPLRTTPMKQWHA